MRIEHINDEFGDISTAVVYKFHKFLPIYRDREGTVLYNINKSWVKSIEGYYVPSRIFYQGGLKKFDDIDFAEYDFRYVLENQKFNSRSLLSYLDSESREMVGKNRGNLNQINSLIFPTTGKDSDSGFEYFNTLLISTTSAYLFSLNPEEYRIELFEDTLESGNYKDYQAGWVFRSFDYIQAISTIFYDESMSTVYSPGSVVLRNGEYYVAQSAVSGIDPGKDESGVWVKVIKPDTIILLGPDAYSDKNRVDYYKDVNMVNGLTRVAETVSNQAHLEDEIYSGKVVWLAISPTNNVRELNLSYAAWLNSEDANRYKNRFNLRNDEYYGNRLDITRPDEDIEVYRDVRNGRILGTEINNNCPILKKKLLRSSAIFESNEYCPEIEYPINSTVMYEGVQFTAIMKNNRGHFPNMSPHWILSSKLTDYYTTRLTILSEPFSGGYTIPNKQITFLNPTGNNSRSEFRVIESLGYAFKGVKWENASGDRINLGEGTDYYITDYSDSDERFRYVTVTREGLNKILGEESRKRIIFDFETVLSKLIMEECLVNKDQGKFIMGRPNSLPSSGQYIYLKQLKVNNMVVNPHVQVERITSGFNLNDKVEYTFYLLDLNNPGNTPYRFDDFEIISTKNSIKTYHPIDTSESSLVSTTEVIGRISFNNIPYITITTTIDYTSSCFEMEITNTRRAIVEKYDEFEVSDTIIDVEYRNTTRYSDILTFYGTYRDCLDAVVINDRSISIEDLLGKDVDINGVGTVRLDVVGKSSIGTTKYTLRMKNVRKDISIQLIAKTE